MKRIFLKVVAILLLGVIVLTQGAVEKDIYKGINDTILYYRTLEKKTKLTPQERKQKEHIFNLIEEYDKSEKGKKEGRISTEEEIAKSIEKSLRANEEVAYHNMKESMNRIDEEIEDYGKDSENIDKAHITLSGDVSHYGYSLHGSMTATGGRFDQWAMTAAHKTLPFGSIVRVTNKDNGKSVTVRINDRGPYIKGRVLDLSRGAFVKIAPQKQGILKANKVIIEVLKYGNGKRKENR